MSRSLLAVLALPFLTACLGEEPKPVVEDPGALVDVSMMSTVGVLLDEVPAADRDRAAEQLLARGAAAWEAAARRQLTASLYRLVYRNFAYDGRGQLPLPPAEQWSIAVGTPSRRTVDGHDVVAVDYTFTSTLLTGAEQPALAEPALTEPGGVWDEPFVLPVDPENLLERTGFACMNESDFPPNSVDTENALSFFDDTCEALSDCHVTRPEAISCVDALLVNVGTVRTAMRYERLAWDAARADAVRVGTQVPGGAQLKALEEGVADNRVIYRYFPADSCAISEGCVGAAGWRRLLQFTATVQNLGAEDAAIGDVSDGSPPVENNMVSFSECHEHMHFNHYGNFTFGTGEMALGSKRAFCLESTARYFNNEDTPLVHPYGCEYQGTAAGWGDDYIAGLDCQWVDVTPVTSGTDVTAPLTFHVNPDAFLCEGEVLRDADGNMLFEETTFLTEAGEPESAIACDEFENWDADNVATADVTVPADGGMVTAACERGSMGATRNCGWREQDEDIACTPGEEVVATCTNEASTSQAVRACEYSQALGTAVACVHNDALGTLTLAAGETAELRLTCPSARDEVESGGAWALYVNAAVDGDAVGTVSCVTADE
jgi:hypothetical protein